MNKKISQFEITSKLNEHDILTVVQEGENRNITGATLNTSLSETFATNERVDGIEQDVTDLSKTVGDNYVDLSNQIVEGDQTVTKNVTGTMNEYYDVLNNTIIILEKKHDTDMSEMSGTMQEWIDDIDDRSTNSQLHDALNKISILENLVTALAEQIASGGGSGIAPGFHTQGTNTIFPLTGYYYTGDASELTTTDTLNQALAKLESQVRQVEGSIGGDTKYVITTGDYTKPTNGNLYSALRSDENYLSATSDDTAYGYIKFLRGFQGGDIYTGDGFLDVGASLYPVNGRWKMVLDDLVVRGSMTVNELIVNEIKATGGDILVSVADMKIIEVERLSDGDFKCYFDTEDGTKYNQFRPGDQAICQIFDGKNVKRYWRLVKEVDNESITLSLEVCEPGSAFPEVGDNILQLGNRYPDGADRRSAIMISAKGEDGPSIKFYNNIDDFTLVNKEYTVIGKNSKFVGTLYQTSSNGDMVRVPADKGVYVAGTTYYYYDRVSYNGSLWLCIANSTVNAPSKNNEEWLEQVSKGEQGAAGADKAKWVEIVGDRLLMYDNPEFTGTPAPDRLALNCLTYNIENPIYEWEIRENGQPIGTESTVIVYPDAFNENRNITVRCTVHNGEETFYDETQLAKLGNGAQGESAYYIDLDNGTMVIPYDASGNNPLISLTGVYTNVYAYYGTQPKTIQQITATTIEGVAETVVEGTKVTLTKLGSASARIKLTVAVDDMVLTKDLWINKVHDGENGFDGVDAAYVVLTGEQVFKYKKEDPTVAVPKDITLSASVYGLTGAVYTTAWFWSVAGNYNWTQIENAVGSNLVVNPNGTYFTNTEEVTFKVEVSVLGGSTYSDMLTVNKLRDGIDGESTYRGRLTNEAHTVAADFIGNVTTAEMSKASTSFMLSYGTQDLVFNKDYSISYTNVDDNISNRLSIDTSKQTLTLSALGASYDSTVFKVEFKVPVNGKVVDVVDMTITKAKGGNPGNQERTAYCRSNESQPGTPSMNRMPTTSGTYSNGNYWYPDQPSSGSYAVWSSTASFDAVTGYIVSGQSWTKPIKVSGRDGIDGEDGAPGPQGNPGPAGPPGPTGLTGPGLNFRGDWKQQTDYELTTEIRDVVKISGQYYACKYSHRSGNYVNYNYWEHMSTFENVATKLLFAEEATIASWQFNNGYIRSINGGAALVGNSDNGSTPVFACGPVGTDSAGWYNNQINENAAVKIWPEGTITVGSGTKYSLAGMTGVANNSNSVRFWAGSTYANSQSAPFKVTQDGSITANKCSLTGTFQTTQSGMRFLISPQVTSDGNIVMQGYDSSNRNLVRVGMYNGGSSSFGFVGVYTDATNSSNPQYYTTMVRNRVELSYKTNSMSIAIRGSLFMASDYFTIRSNAWATQSQASSGDVYKDANGFLKVK